MGIELHRWRPRGAEDKLELVVLDFAGQTAFYATNRQGLPLQWIKRALRSAATVPDYFNTHRMVGEYVDWLYKPGHGGSHS